MNERNRLINKIQMAHFCMLDSVLYLDTHPNDRKALAHYQKYRDMYLNLVDSYEDECGPLSISGNNSDNKWNWINCPWPWEGEAN